MKNLPESSEAPPWWHAALVTMLLAVSIIALAFCSSSCTFTLDGESLVRSVRTYQSAK